MSYYKQFDKIYKDIYSSLDTSKLPEKYLNIKQLYNRFLNRLEMIKNKGLVSGLDFGCGVGGTSVLGKLMGLDIWGLDIPYFDKRHSQGEINPYFIVQKEKKMGYNMINMDTSIFPWGEFRDDQFQFLLAFNSLDDDYSSNHNTNHVSFKRRSMINRMSEILRIMHKDSIWLVGSTHKYRALLKSEFHKDQISKTDIDIKLWRK